MYLFTRTGLLGGRPADAIAWATKIGAHVATTSKRPVTTWAAGFGHPLGTVAWNVVVESHADLEAAFAMLPGDAAYNALLDEGQALATAPMEDTFAQVIGGSAGAAGEPPALGSVASVTRAVISAGMYAQAVAWGTQVTDHIATLTPNPMTFLMSAYGPFGGLVWIATAPSMAALDEANDAINLDAGYNKLLGEAAGLFEAGTGHRALFSRIA